VNSSNQFAPTSVFSFALKGDHEPADVAAQKRFQESMTYAIAKSKRTFI
jgi:hypothetical protein